MAKANWTSLITAVTFLLTLTPTLTKATCPQPHPGCTCQTITQITCVAPSTLCPSSLPANFTQVTLSGYVACGSSLTRDAFRNLTSLRTLRMAGFADYQMIEDHAFADTVLIDLTITESTINTLSVGSFSGVSGLEKLDLSANDITTVADFAFQDLGNLNRLLLSQNSLTSLSDSIFAGLSKLVILDLTNNSIETLSPNCFQPLRSLRSLKLSYNRLMALPDGFLSGVPMTSLIVDHNRLADIGPQAFTGSHLLAFQLSHNLLTQFPGSALVTLPGEIMALFLSDNLIDKIGPGDASGLRIRRLSLSNNPLKTVDVAAFSGTSVTSSFDLQGTELTSLPSDLEQSLTSTSALLLQGQTAWECTCESLWLAQFMVSSSASSDPVCADTAQGMRSS